MLGWPDISKNDLALASYTGLGVLGAAAQSSVIKHQIYNSWTRDAGSSTCCIFDHARSLSILSARTFVMIRSNNLILDNNLGNDWTNMNQWYYARKQGTSFIRTWCLQLGKNKDPNQNSTGQGVRRRSSWDRPLPMQRRAPGTRLRRLSPINLWGKLRTKGPRLETSQKHCRDSVSVGKCGDYENHWKSIEHKMCDKTDIVSV